MSESTIIKKGKTYYLVLRKRDWPHKPAVIVPVKFIRKKHRCSDYAVVEYRIDGRTYNLTVNVGWLAPHNMECAENLLHNMKICEKRWAENNWRFALNHKTAKTEITRALSELSKRKRAEILNLFKNAYPDLLNSNGSFKISKMKMKHWDELAWCTITYKYPFKRSVAIRFKKNPRRRKSGDSEEGD